MYILQNDLKEISTYFRQVDDALSRYQIPHGLFPIQKTIGARDYMPRQIEKNKFIQYRYYLNYLVNDLYGISYITDPNNACKTIGIKTLKTNIVIDGGNIVKYNECIVMTEKVFKEKPNYRKS